MQKKILKYALQNAVKFNGKANIKAIIGKLFQENKNLNLKNIIKDINKTIKEVNSLTLEQQKQKLKHFGIKEAPKKQERTSLKPLPKAKGKIIMRFAPSPSGPLHLGSAMTLGATSEYCKEYKGTLILRIEDTNPDNIYIPAYKMIQEESQWLTNNVSKTIIQSERIPIYYKYIEKLLEMEKAYICTCDPEHYRKLLYERTPCPCRNLSKKENKERWKKMLKSYKQGEAVVRLKTDLDHKNPAIRDFPLARINTKEHPKQGKKYRVWPLMNLSVFVDDVESKVTHIIRGKDHADNAKRQEFLYKYFSKKLPVTLFHGRVNFTDMQLSSSKTREAIKNKKYTGWDDIRLPFLSALKRRGYNPKSILKWARSVGVSLTDKKVSKDEFFKIINAFNKELIDPTAKRYFFIKEPKKITIKNAPKRKIKLKLHPDKKLGFRTFETDQNFYIEKSDFEKLKNNKICRLMDCLNFTKKGNQLIFHSLEYPKYKEKGDFIMHWLPSKKLIKAEIRMPDNSLLKGIAESIKNIKVDETIQFERFAFVRLDKKSKDKLSFWFTHK